MIIRIKTETVSSITTYRQRKDVFSEFSGRMESKIFRNTAKERNNVMANATFSSLWVGIKKTTRFRFPKKKMGKIRFRI